MALPADVITWLNEDDDSPGPVEFFVISSRVFGRLQERGALQAKIDRIFRSLAPLEFNERHAGTSSWDCFFAPKMEAEEGRSEFPNLAELTSENVDEWADLAESLTQPHSKARFADAVWELGKRLGSTRKDLYRFGRAASESYLEVAARPGSTPLEILNAAPRSIQLAMQLGAGDLVDRGYEFLMQYADSVDQAHIGLWGVPFDRLLGLNGLSDAQRDRILERHAQRFEATVASGDIFRMEMVGPSFAKYFHDRRQYLRAKEITFAYGEAILKSTAPLNASLATHHIEAVLEAYRRVGLKEETDRVRVLLEEKGKGVLTEMKSQRFELKLDSEAIDTAIAKMIDVSNPLVALYRLANNCAPHPERFEAEFEAATEGLIFHKLFPVSIIGDDGLTVTTIGTYDQDKEGRLVMELARDMRLKATFFLSGLEEWKKKFELGGIPDAPSLFDSLLIPPDRVTLFQEGLLAFEREDHVKCIHVLVFQVENSLRELLRILGRPVSKSTDDGNQPKNMNDVLHDSVVKDALDPKLWSFLKVLYTDNRGMNLRNLVAHGVAPAGAFNRVNAALVVQSVVFLALIRDEAMYVEREQAEGFPAVPKPAEENVEAAGDVPEKDERDILAVSVSPVV
jgi:lysyl-tRNA synthetase class 1